MIPKQILSLHNFTLIQPMIAVKGPGEFLNHKLFIYESIWMFIMPEKSILLLFSTYHKLGISERDNYTLPQQTHVPKCLLANVIQM